MAFSSYTKKRRIIKAGQEGFEQLTGKATFSTTDETGDIVTGLKKIEVVILAYESGPTAAETLKWAQSSGTITVTRVGASISSAAVINYIVIGY